MNASTLTYSFLIFFAAIHAIPVGKRQAGDNSYGDEPSLPTQAAYEVIEITTFKPMPEQEAQAVKNGVPSNHAIVVESGYRSRRQSGDNTQGDKSPVKTQSTYGIGEAKMETPISEKETQSALKISPREDLFVRASGY